MGQPRTMSPELTELRTRVLQWRKHDGGGRGTRIPEKLWQEAILVARIDGVYATAQATRLNYRRLKELCDEVAGRGKEPAQVPVRGQSKSPQVTQGGTGGGARFITVPMAAPRIGPHATIELVGRHGDRLRVEVTGELDLSGLMASLWNCP